MLASILYHKRRNISWQCSLGLFRRFTFWHETISQVHFIRGTFQHGFFLASQTFLQMDILSPWTFWCGFFFLTLHKGTFWDGDILAPRIFSQGIGAEMSTLLWMVLKYPDAKMYPCRNVPFQKVPMLKSCRNVPVSKNPSNEESPCQNVYRDEMFMCCNVH